MAFKRVTLSIDEDLNILWNEVSKKHRIPKSAMVEKFLYSVLDELNNLSIRDAAKYEEIFFLKKRGKNLFDLEYD